MLKTGKGLPYTLRSAVVRMFGKLKDKCAIILMNIRYCNSALNAT